VLEPAVDDAESAPDGDSPDGDAIARGSTIGRYVVLEPIGAGASGVVYRALDPELGRGVALKVLRPRGPEPVRAAIRARLQREAQALAKVSDPHVVAVFDVGVERELTWLAMELVRGRNLRAHLATRARSPAEVVALFADAGRGLVAAHRVGLVHRDFKPENVLVADDGRVCVSDFGLARPDPTTGDADAGASAVLAMTVTREGDLVGTPAYMAPEQHAGMVADPRADQFAFCVALVEALVGERPFSGADVASLAAAKRDASRAAAAVDRIVRVPTRLRAALRRGLDPDPAQRFRSMQELVDQLDRARAGATRLRAAAAIVGTTAVAALLGGLLGRDDAMPCAAEDVGETSWSATRREDVATAIAGFAGATALVDRLDELAAATADADRRICEATWVAGEQSPALFEHRRACVQRRRAQLDVVAAMLVAGEPAALAHADALVDGLVDASACIGATPSGAAADDPASRERGLTLARVLDEAAAQGRVGQWARAAERLAAIEAEVRAVEDPALLAELLRLRAQAGGRERTDDRDALDEALAISRAAADARGEAEAWLLRGEHHRAGGDAEEVELCARMAAAALTLAGGDARLQLRIDALNRR
jgi:hypothetical protein